MIVLRAVKSALPTKRTKPAMVSMMTAEKKLREMRSKHSRAALQKLYPCMAINNIRVEKRREKIRRSKRMKGGGGGRGEEKEREMR